PAKRLPLPNGPPNLIAVALLALRTSSASVGLVVPMPTFPALYEMFEPWVIHCEPAGESCQAAVPSASDVSTLPMAAPVGRIRPAIRAMPFTSSVAAGVAVPMPTLPRPVIRITSRDDDVLHSHVSKRTSAVLPQPFVPGSRMVLMPANKPESP